MTFLFGTQSVTDIFRVLTKLAEELAFYSPTPQLDAELLLASALKVPLNRLYAHLYACSANTRLTENEQRYLAIQSQRRKKGEPMAYILGTQGFWSLHIAVNPHTLIPRPATELLVERVLMCLPGTNTHHVLDLGTGSGAIALAIAHERPHWTITASDDYPEALNTAQSNAQHYQINNITFVRSDWYKALQGQLVDAIVSNPPYLKPGDPHLERGDLRFEPKHALISAPDGLTALRTVIDGSPALLRSGGYLLLEHGFDQGEAVRNFMKQAGYTHIQQYKDLNSHERVVVGQR